MPDGAVEVSSAPSAEADLGVAAPAGDPLEALFSGGRASMRPVYDAFLEAVRAVAPDARVTAGRTLVSFARRRVFAQVRVMAGPRLDLQLALGDTAPTDRLPAGPNFGKGGCGTHRVALQTVDDVDADVRFWLGAAYLLDE
jgi:hypothetical protein